MEHDHLRMIESLLYQSARPPYATRKFKKKGTVIASIQKKRKRFHRKPRDTLLLGIEELGSGIISIYPRLCVILPRISRRHLWLKSALSPDISGHRVRCIKGREHIIGQGDFDLSLGC